VHPLQHLGLLFGQGPQKNGFNLRQRRGSLAANPVTTTRPESQQLLHLLQPVPRTLNSLLTSVLCLGAIGMTFAIIPPKLLLQFHQPRSHMEVLMLPGEPHNPNHCPKPPQLGTPDVRPDQQHHHQSNACAGPHSSYEDE
jgi:hypothetical protein